MSHESSKGNSACSTVLIVIVISVGGLVEIVPLALSAAAKQGDVTIVPRTALAAGWLRYLRARGLLSVPLTDDPAVSQRNRALWSVFGCGGVAIRPSVRVWLQAHRARTWLGSGAVTATTGIACICTIRATWCRSPTCQDSPGWRRPSSTGR